MLTASLFLEWLLSTQRLKTQSVYHSLAPQLQRWCFITFAPKHYADGPVFKGFSASYWKITGQNQSDDLPVWLVSSLQISLSPHVFVRSFYAKLCYCMLWPFSTELLGGLMSDRSEDCDISLTNDFYLPATHCSLSQLAQVTWLSSDHIYLIRTLPNTNLAWIITMRVPTWEYFSIIYFEQQFLKLPHTLRYFSGCTKNRFLLLWEFRVSFLLLGSVLRLLKPQVFKDKAVVVKYLFFSGFQNLNGCFHLQSLCQQNINVNSICIH